MAAPSSLQNKPKKNKKQDFTACSMQFWFYVYLGETELGETELSSFVEAKYQARESILCVNPTV